MKKLLYVGLIVLGTMTLPSCGGSETKTEETTTTDSATTAEPEAAPVDTAAPAMSDSASTTTPADSAK